jgi:16S rRNA (adenine1518-N6/adenine1519-N6)-dimethyltransferase
MDPQRKRHAFGQHFLKDPRICNAIVEAALNDAHTFGCKTLLEIGPGRGAITDLLIERQRSEPGKYSFILVEKDRDLAAGWRESQPGVTVECADFLRLPEERWISSPPVAVVSNLPYSAGTAIVIALAKHPDKIPTMTLMFQAEVAQRLYAQPGTKSWGSLSIWIQNRWDVKRLLHVPPGAFHPRPKVNSEVVSFHPRKEPRIVIAPTAEADQHWEKLLKVCFLHRRKMLRSALPKNSIWSRALEKSGIDPTLRAEALSWENWEQLYRASLAGSDNVG